MRNEIEMVFYLCEKTGSLEIISRKDALRMIMKHGSHAKIKAPLTMYYYVPTDDEWYPAHLEKNTRVDLDGPRPNAIPPFQSMKALLKQMGRSDFRKMSQFVAYFRLAKRAGKFPWVQEPFEVYSHSIGKRGYVPMLELLYSLDPDAFEVLERLLGKPEEWERQLTG